MYSAPSGPSLISTGRNQGSSQREEVGLLDGLGRRAVPLELVVVDAAA